MNTNKLKTPPKDEAKTIARLHCITLDKLPYSHSEQTERLCQAGATWIQLRMKGAPFNAWVSEAKKAKAICDAHNAKLIVNDSVKVALESSADGVHLGQSDGDPQEARQKLGSQAIIGGTVNTLAHAYDALQSQAIDYVGVGPFRFTSTKKDLNPVLSRETLKEILTLLGKTPTILIGGITFNDIDEILALGAYGIAMISDLYKNNYNIPSKYQRW